MQVLRYLGRYTHRVAISNHRLLALEQERVTFRWKDYAHGGKQGKMTLVATEFLRRFFLHVLPREDSCASVTSGSSPIAFAPPAWHYPDNCCPVAPPPLSRLEPAKLRRRVLLSGIAHAAARP